MKTVPALLFLLSLGGMWLAQLATLPLLTGSQVERASAPMDEEVVRAASDRLMGAVTAWYVAALMATVLPTRPAAALAFALVACTADRAWDVVLILVAWSGHVPAEVAVHYWVGLALPCATLLYLGAVGAMAGARALGYY